MELDFSSPLFWIALGQIVLIDIVLSGDNAVVIALACRNLPPEQRQLGIVWGVAGAVILRILLTSVAALVLNLPWLKVVGAALLLWIAIQLLVPEDEAGPDIAPARHLWGAVRTIIIADLVMSLDNVIGVAGAAGGNLVLLVFGLALSIPLIVWSSQIILRMMQRWPVIVTAGAALLGFVAGQMCAMDPGLDRVFGTMPDWLPNLAGVGGALLVVVLGRWLAIRAAARQNIKLL